MYVPGLRYVLIILLNLIVNTCLKSELEELCENEILLRQYRFPWEEIFNIADLLRRNLEKPIRIVRNLLQRNWKFAWL